jgi:hypothetical protein
VIAIVSVMIVEPVEVIVTLTVAAPSVIAAPIIVVDNELDTVVGVLSPVVNGNVSVLGLRARMISVM